MSTTTPKDDLFFPKEDMKQKSTASKSKYTSRRRQQQKKGKSLTFYGYMDAFFKKQPPLPEYNLIIDSNTLKIIEDLGNKW